VRFSAPFTCCWYFSDLAADHRPRSPRDSSLERAANSAVARCTAAVYTAERRRIDAAATCSVGRQQAVSGNLANSRTMVHLAAAAMPACARSRGSQLLATGMTNFIIGQWLSRAVLSMHPCLYTRSGLFQVAPWFCQHRKFYKTSPKRVIVHDNTRAITW
jgi:hypothetical protein